MEELGSVTGAVVIGDTVTVYMLAVHSASL
jgi:hypothetical protein